MTRKRQYTYSEKKFNRFGRSGLINYFKPKYSTSKIKVWGLTEHDYRMSNIEAEAIRTKLEAQTYEEEKGFIESVVDSILHFTEMFDLDNIEAFAMWCHVVSGVYPKGENIKLSEEELLERMNRTMKEAYELYETNPNRFLNILKLLK